MFNMFKFIKSVYNNITNFLGDKEFFTPTPSIDYTKEWLKYHKECTRIENLFNNELINLDSYIQHLNTLERIRANLMNLIKLEHKQKEK